MFFDAFADEFHSRPDNEIPLYLFPKEMELVVGAPHIDAAAGQGVVLIRGVVTGGAENRRRANVAMTIKLAQRIFLRKSQMNS